MVLTMIKLALVSLALGVDSATWGSHSATLPQHDWVVLDYAAGGSFGVGMTASATHVYTTGSMASSLKLMNPITGAGVQGADEGSDRDVFVAKVTVDGVPEAVFTYPSAEDSTGLSTTYPRDIHVSEDGETLVLGGYFTASIVFGDTTLVNERATAQADESLKDGFVAKVRAFDGSVVWAYQSTATLKAYVYGTAFGPASGDVFSCGSTQNVDDAESFGIVSLHDGDTGALKWEKTWGIGVGTVMEVMPTADESVLVAVGSFVGSLDFGGAVGVLETTVADVAEAIVLGLDPSNGRPLWATRVSGDGDAASASHIDVKDGYAYVSCGGGCGTAHAASGAAVALGDSAHSGAVLKLDAANGEVVWIADAPSAHGIAASTADSPQGSAVYVHVGQSGDFALGDVAFPGRGGQDQYVLKIDGEDGSGSWALQSGGNDLEYLRRIAIDPFGDLYTSGRTDSDPVYFDPFAIDSHITDDQGSEDMWVAKLATSAESLPDCFKANGDLKAGHCFIGNRCYADGDAGLGTRACLGCDSALSADAYSGPASGCFVDGACVDEGAMMSVTASSWAGGGTTWSSCQYCDGNADAASFSVLAGWTMDPEAALGAECAPPADYCTVCGACYGGISTNPDERITCVAEWTDGPAPCSAFYAVNACPDDGPTCEANSATADGCGDLFDHCCGADGLPMRGGGDDDEAESGGGGGGEGACKACGACYTINGGHSITCEEEKTDACAYWYAPYECPDGVTCQEANSEYGRDCVAQLEGCCGEDGEVYVAEAGDAHEDHGECTHCGACYNMNGGHAMTCVEEYTDTCAYWYAPYECPDGVTCQEANSDHGRNCVAELENCCHEHGGDHHEEEHHDHEEDGHEEDGHAGHDDHAEEEEEHDDHDGHDHGSSADMETSSSKKKSSSSADTTVVAVVVVVVAVVAAALAFFFCRSGLSRSAAAPADKFETAPALGVATKGSYTKAEDQLA